MGEIAKRALKWPKHFSNTAALVTLDMPTSRCHIFQRKLNFLRRLVTPEALESNRIGPATTKTFADDIEDLCLVKECRELDSMFNSDFTTKVLTDDCNQREMKSIIQSLDKEHLKGTPNCSSCHQRRELAEIVGLCQSPGLKTSKGPTKPNQANGTSWKRYQTMSSM